ncbi:PhzF family phenazine biosynthesis protein [Streptomyces sp. NRRL F-5727]|uniref:PhzF family phenazine biosynthesis protein n=1 Tax=Streptomyces sp. NRRL F-5727 TaxID=1463871 RepID=UPI0004C5DD24|nr:PhzF family phenazine biosynthesis protein [Streptomyces sp. NRRL F-5727]
MTRSATLVRACLRGTDGGSPTAVIEEPRRTGAAPGPSPERPWPLTDDERRLVPGLLGASHAVFVTPPAPAGGGAPAYALRFFTSEGELPACGHGTVAALAHIAARTGAFDGLLRTAGRVFVGRARRGGDGLIHAAFDPGPVELRQPEPAAYDLLLPALGLGRLPAGPGGIASVGRPRLLLPVADRAELAALAPDVGLLRAACDRLGLLGVYVYSAPTREGRAAARMFAPSIGVDEDIANANSTACLAALLAEPGRPLTLTVDMGDSLGHPATLTATARPGPDGRPRILLGGTASG